MPATPTTTPAAGGSFTVVRWGCGCVSTYTAASAWVRRCAAHTPQPMNFTAAPSDVEAWCADLLARAAALGV